MSVMPPLYRYAFRYFDGPTSTWMYYAILGGVVDVTTGPEWLSQGPKEWQEEGASIDRDFEYFGMMIANSTPMSWTGEPARILRHIFLTQGIEGKCDLYIEMFNSDESVFDYKQYLPSNFSLDFSTFVSEYDWVSINAMEGGFVAKLKARGDTQYEIDVQNHADVKYIYNDGIELQARLNWSSGAGIADEFAGNTFDEFPRLNYNFKEGTNVSTRMFDTDPTTPQPDFMQNIAPSSISYKIRVAGSYIITPNGSYTGGGHFTIRLLEHLSTGGASVAVHDIYIHSSAMPTGTNSIFNIDETITITLPSTRQFSLGHIIAGGPLGSSDPSLAFTNGAWSTAGVFIDVSAEFVNRYEPSYMASLKIEKVIEEIITKINDDAFTVPTFYSDLISTTLNSEIYIACGDSIRALEGSKMKVSLNQVFNLLKYNFNAAAYYDYDLNRFYINDLGYVFKSSLHSTLPSLGVAKTCKVLPFSSQQFVNLTIGGGNFTYDQERNDDLEITNGKDEINLNYKLLSPLTKVRKDINYVSDVRYDPHGIENLRINFSGKKISDSASDNDLFAIHASKDADGTFQLNGSITTDYRNLIRTPIDLTAGASFFNIENIFSPESIYNVIFFPIKSIYRCGAWFRSLLKFNDSDYLKFQSTAKNNANSIKPIISEGVGPVVYDGNADILVSSLCQDGRELFYPVLLELTLEEPINMFQKFNGDKYAFTTVEHLGNIYKIFVNQLATKPADRGETKVLALPTIDNDLTLLER